MRDCHYADNDQKKTVRAKGISSVGTVTVTQQQKSLDETLRTCDRKFLGRHLMPICKDVMTYGEIKDVNRYVTTL